MVKPHSDVLVIFSVTGDLAYKMIFPASAHPSLQKGGWYNPSSADSSG
jgi:glucose-6-phosphate 1-dehydrogenase